MYKQISKINLRFLLAVSEVFRKTNMKVNGCLWIKTGSDQFNMKTLFLFCLNSFISSLGSLAEHIEFFIRLYDLWACHMIYDLIIITFTMFLSHFGTKNLRKKNVASYSMNCFYNSYLLFSRLKMNRGKWLQRKRSPAEAQKSFQWFFWPMHKTQFIH